jgi:hypothetical protein
VAEWKEIGEGLAGATKDVSAELKAAEADARGAPSPPNREAGRAPAANGSSPNGSQRPAVPLEERK